MISDFVLLMLYEPISVLFFNECILSHERLN